MPVYTIQDDHFIIHYQDGLEATAREAGAILNQLYDIYRNTYQLVLPEKTEVLVIDNDMGDGWAMDLSDIILIAANGLDFTNLRGTHDYLRDVVTHEFAHIVSITAAHKFQSTIPYLQGGFFSHPNEMRRVEGMLYFPGEILPPWFFEGISQFESTRHGADAWDSHRDMILRSLALSKKLLPYDHMFVFAGKGDDFEKTYNHGLSLVRYIADTWGYEKVTAILRESAKPTRLDFDRVIRPVLGISGRELYRRWKQSLIDRYEAQLKSIGKQVYGHKINKDGYDNAYPRFSADEKKIYFISNGKADYSYFYRSLYSYSLIDTVKEDKRIKVEAGGIKGDYSIHKPSGLIAFSSMKSGKSTLASGKGNLRVRDVFIDTLPREKESFDPFRKKTERQVSKKMSLFHPAFSPKGDMIVAGHHDRDRYFICLSDTAGKNIRMVYPDSARPDAAIATIFSFDWSPDGRRIALSYIDQDDRKVGIYDTLTRELITVCDTKGDERDPRFSSDGTMLYFASDRTGIFNIYRCELGTGRLQRVTNVSGGAFMPDISKNGKKLVYTNYDAAGFGIYLLDSIAVVEELGADTALLAARAPVPAPAVDNSYSSPKRYSAFPRKLIWIPTLLAEQAVTRDNDPSKGVTVTKAGVVFNAFDPFSQAALSSGLFTGNFLGGYLLLDPSRVLTFIDPKRGLISPEINYDFGLFGETSTLPLPLSFEYMQRGITGQDYFFDEIEGATFRLPYDITPYSAYLKVAYYWTRGGMGDEGMNGVSVFGGYDRTDVTLLLDAIYSTQTTFLYNIAKSFRAGAYWAFMGIAPEPTMNIAPKGLMLKAQYTLYDQKLIDDEKSFNRKGQENYDIYAYNELKAHLIAGFASPWHKKHVFLLDAGAAGADLFKLPKKFTNFPYYYEPEIYWHPGYAYYERATHYDTLVNTVGDTTYKKLPYLKGVIAGNTLAWGGLSYRFPLWPGSIDRKVSVWYLDHLYGALSTTAAAGFRTIDEIRNRPRDDLFRRSDWLVSAGAEVRLETLMYSNYPCGIKLKWDYGMDRPAPVGGHRFSISAGFGFDNWGMIDGPELRPNAGL